MDIDILQEAYGLYGRMVKEPNSVAAVIVLAQFIEAERAYAGEEEAEEHWRCYHQGWEEGYKDGHEDASKAEDKEPGYYDSYAGQLMNAVGEPVIEAEVVEAALDLDDYRAKRLPYSN